MNALASIVGSLQAVLATAATWSAATPARFHWSRPWEEPEAQVAAPSATALPTSPLKWRSPPAPILCAIGWQSAATDPFVLESDASFWRAALGLASYARLPNACS